MSETGPWLIVGLGNPGAKYAGNRHNLGQRVIETLCADQGARLTSHRSGAQVAGVRLGAPGQLPSGSAHLALPASYMNVSGRPVAALAKYFRIPAERILVVHDELDLDAHTLRLKQGGGEGGHNGLRSISQALGTRDYCRLRIGIGRPPGRMEGADWVLATPPAKERADWEVTERLAAEAVIDVVCDGFAAAQQRLHTQS